MSFEYKVVPTTSEWVKNTIKETIGHLEDQLDEESRRGWELVTAIAGVASSEERTTVLVFRRPQ